MSTKKLKEFYDAAKADGVSLPDFDTYKKCLSKEAKRREYYEVLKADGVSLPDFETFDRVLTPDDTSFWFNDFVSGVARAIGSHNSSTGSNRNDGSNRKNGSNGNNGSDAGAAQQTQTPEASTERTAQAQTPQAPQARTSQAQEPAWQPTTQERIRMMEGVRTAVQPFSKSVQGRTDAVRRNAERHTAEGLQRQRLAEARAEAAGLDTRLTGMGGVPGRWDAGSYGNNENDGSGATPDLTQTASPVVYDTTVDEQGRTQIVWLMPDGTLTSDRGVAEQGAARARQNRLMSQFVDRMRTNGLDPAKQADVQKQAQLDYEEPMRRAVDIAWNKAEDADKAANDAYDKEVQEHGMTWRDAIASSDANGMHVTPPSTRDIADMRRRVSHKKAFSLAKMTEDALANMPEYYRKEMLDAYTQHFKGDRKKAEAAFRDKISQMLYGRLVERAMPKGTAEFVARKIADGNLVSPEWAAELTASAMADSYDENIARNAAMAQYGKEHRVADIFGTVAGMAADPVTYVSGGVGGAAGKAAMSTVARTMAEGSLKGAAMGVAKRVAGSTLGGRLAAGMVGGGATLGPYEALKNIQEQMYTGGVADYSTGKRGGYSLGAVLGAAGRGVVLGTAMGSIAPVTGNVADRIVGKVGGTAGKAGVRAAQGVTNVVAEGTVFAMPEWISGDADFVDAWTDGMATALGFKVSHAIKSVPRTIEALRPKKDARGRVTDGMDFEQRLRERLNGAGKGMALTKEEERELRDNGYGGLADLFGGEHVKTNGKVHLVRGKDGTWNMVVRDGEGVKERPEGTTTKEERASAPYAGNVEMDGYDAMRQLMGDGRVSEAARAKCYWILTGRTVPMSTVAGWQTEEHGDGTYTVRSVTAGGDVITSRRFKNKRDAQGEEMKIRRQAEYNTVEVGERYADRRAFEAAAEDIAGEYGTTAEAVRNAAANVEAGKGTAGEQEIYNRYGEALETRRGEMSAEAIRKRIEAENVCSIDAILGKSPDKRTEAEQAVVERYLEELYPEGMSNKSDRSYESTGNAENTENAGGDNGQKRLPGGVGDELPPEGPTGPIGPNDTGAPEDANAGRAGNVPTAEAETARAEAMSAAYESLEEAFGGREDLLADVKDDPWEMLRDPELTGEQREAVVQLLNVESGMSNVELGDAQSQGMTAEVAVAAARRVNHESGMVVPARTVPMKDAPSEDVYIVSGEVRMQPDGSVIDRGNSDSFIVVCDSEGNYHATSPERLESVGEAVTPEQWAKTMSNVAQEQPQETGVGNNENDRNNGSDGGEPMRGEGLAQGEEPAGYDVQGNPVDGQGRLVVESVGSMDEITDGDFESPTRNVQLPDLPENVAAAIGSGGKPIVIKKSVFEKNRDNHPEIDAAESRSILERALYNPDLVGSVQARRRPDYRVAIQTGDRNAVVVLDIYESKDNTEIVGWREINERGLERMRRQAAKDDGQLIILSPSDKSGSAAALSTLQDGLSSVGKGSENGLDAQGARASALSRVPTDAKGEPMFEQAEDAATAWDALVEYSGGDVATAKEIAAVMAQEKRNEYERARKLKPKGKTPAEILASKRDIAAEQSRTQLEYERWRQMAEVERGREAVAEREREAVARRAAAEQAERERAERAAQAEADRLRLERLNGVPDWRADTPEHARARGYRRSGPEVVERQGAVEAVRGKDVRVKFAKDTTADGVAAVIDVDDLQPSHVQGNRNVRHFIPEAQPKDRKDAVSKVSAQDIARDIRPEEITGSITAYTGAPSVNGRGETIQGNSRADALKWMYDSELEQAAKYKAYLVEHAADFGMDAEDIEAMERPVLVNMLDVSDGEAIRLGQYVQADTESGGVERIRGRAAARKMGADMREYAERLLSSEDEDASISQLVAANGVKTLQWMNTRGYITDTQYASCFDRKGELTGNAAEDLKDVLYQGIFEGGSVEIEEMFAKLPAKVQRAILATAYRDYDSPEADSIRGEIQQAIVLYNEMMMYPQYAGATNIESALTAVAAWSQQYAFDDASGESYLPAERFSNFALHLAAMYKGMSQRGLQKMFNDLYDTIQGVGEDTLFESVERTPHTIAEAVKKVLGIDYKPVNERNNGETGNVPMADDSEVGQGGGRGSTTDVGSRERVAGTGRAYERGAGASDDSRGSGKGREIKPSEVDGRFIGRSLSESEAADLVGRMEASAEVAPTVELTPENWLAQFGEDGMVDTPIGVVKMGENQFIKMYSRGRAEYFGMVYPTLHTPDVIMEKNAPAEGAERDTKFIFVKTFVKDDGSRLVHFESITVQRDGMEVSESSHEAAVKDIKKDMQNEKILHISEKLSPGSEGSLTETSGGSKRPDLVPASDGTSLRGKDTTKSADVQGKNDNIVGGQGETPMSAKIKTASAEVNTDPTEAQKEAGNYKKGHVQVGTFDITIEQPQGSVRKGTDADGKQWESKMNNTYGYIRGAVGVDGDHIDVFLSNDIDGWNGRKVFVVDQYNPDGSFDEHKVMLGFNDQDEAKGDYLANYEQGWENGRRIDITGVNLEDFEKWIESSKRKTKPFGEYSSVKKDVVEEKNGGSGLNGRTGNTGSNGENENNGSNAAEIARLEELLEKPGADKKLVRAEIARLRGEGQKAAKPDEGVEQVDADLAAKLRKSPGFELSTKKVKGKVTVNPKDYAPWRKTAEDNKRPQLRGVHYEEGLAMATDTASIIMVRSKYPTAWEGKTIGWYGKALDFEHGYVPWRELLSMRRKAAYAVDAAAFKAAVEQARADEASGEFNVSDYAIGVPYHGGKIYIALKRAELLADLLDNVKHGELRLNGTGQYLCLSGDGVYSIHMGVSKESLSYGLGTHVVDIPSGGVKQSKADGAVAEGVEASEAVLRDAVIGRLREAGVEVVTDVAAGQKVLDEANEETGMSNAGQQQVRLHARLSALTKAANTIRGWLDGNKRGKTFTIELPEATQRMIRKVMGRDFDSHNITANGVVHAQKNHGVGGRKLNERSIPLTKVDMELMPYIMTAPDYVRRGSDDMSGRVSVRFYKELGNGYVVVAEKEYKNSPDDMETITMWAEMSDKATNAQREAALDTHVQNAILDIDAAKIRRDAENAIENDIKIREHRVYHGSGADFESFDHSHMGTGEGAQVFGWGTYVTEVEGIGRGYATKVVTNNSTNLSSIARQHNAKRFLKKYPTFEAFKAYVDETRPDKSDIALNYYNQNVDDAKGQRHLYTVEIPEDTGENYIDHDKGLTPSQATRVRTALEGIGVDLEDFARRGWRLDMPFEYVYNIMIPNAIRGSRYEVAGNVQRKASEFLSQLGFTGIKYPAEYTSGGRADGAKNYVIFDDKDLKITDHVRFFRTGEGEAYGFTVGGKIYIDPRIATAETPVHEYAHLWAEALRCGNAEEWSNVVGLMKDTPVWDEVRERYPELESEDEIADEVIATYSGRRGAERLREEAKKVAEGRGSVFEKAEAISALERVKQALARFWKGVCDFLHIRYTSAEEVADRVMKDMLDGVNPREVLHKNEQNAVIQRVNPMEDDYHTGVRGVEDIRTLREAIAEARAEGEEGGWDALSSYPDVSNAMLEAVLRSGRVRVYSSKPIEAGVFVTPSRMQAEDYAGGGKVYSKEVSVDDVAWLNTDEGQLADVMSKDETGMSNRLRFQYVGENGAEGLEAANARFNAELELQIDGKLPIGHVYKMGRPSEFLRAAGIPNLPIELPASQLSLKASSGKHDFDLQEVRDLPKAIANPIATFAYGDKGKSQNILTLLDHNGEKFLVGIFIRPTVKGRVLEVNSIRNVFPKNSESIVRWILDGKLTNANKKELLAFLDQQRTNLADVAFVLPAEQAKQGIQEVLETAAKVVENFENPKVSGGKDAEAGQNENNGNAGNYGSDSEAASIVASAKEAGTYMKAPNGRTTRLTADQWVSVRTRNFKRWFGDWENEPEKSSKVVDENGEPMVVYHGRSVDFNTFERHEGSRYTAGLERRVVAEGYFFTPDEEFAETYARNAAGVRGGKADVIACFLNIRRPMDLVDNDTYAETYEYVTGWEYTVADMQDELWSIMDEEGIADKIKSKGYDGVMFAEELNDAYEPTKISYCILDANQAKYAEGNNGDYSKMDADMRYRTSEELDSEYGRRWLDEQTNSDGRHTTQVKNTLSSYQKFGEWVKREARGREVDVLDASSGLGIGTEWMRDNGIKVEDVEPYPSERRAAPTYKSYGDIKKKYDYIISNAVLNVIPDDWRAGVLHDMADKLKDGGRMVLNVRSAESIRRQGKEGETRITLDDPSEILVLRPDGSIKAYQKGFTKTELKEWCEKELGAGYKVEIANKGNAGGSYDTAVVVTKNNESGTVGVASETGRPSRSAQAVSNSGAKVGKKSEYRDGLEEISDRLDEKAMGAHEFLYNIAKAFGLKGAGLRASFYQDLGNSVGIRVSDHSANTDNIASKNANSEVYGLVVKLGRHRFKSNADADYLEYVYYPDRLDGARQKEIVDGLKGFVDSGDYTLLPKPDRVNRSGWFEVAESGFSDENNGKNEKTGNNSDPEVMTARARELAELLNTPVRIIRTEEEVAALPSVRQRRMKGSFNPMTGEVIIVVPNNANMADIENTFVHEVVGHDGLRVLFPDEAKLNNALDELYRVSKDEIRSTIDRMAQKMYDAEVDRIREKKRKEHEANGEDANASYYADMAAAHAEAGKKREQFKRDATEEYGADLAGRIGEKGFEKMSAAEQTFWGRLKAMLQKALQRLLDGLKIRSKRQWGDKEWAFVLHEAFKRKRNGGRPTIFDMADTEVMRRKTGFGEMSNVESYGRDGKGNQKETVNLQYGKRLGQNQSGEYRRPEGSADGREVDTDASRRLAAVSDRSDIRVFEEGHSAHREQHIDDSQRYRREAEGERLVAIAKANGLFIPREKIKSFGERVSKQSRESEVYINFDESRVYKVKNPYAMAGSWYKNHIEAEDAIYEYLLHNKYFPETAYKFEGIAEDVDGVRIVLSQPLIKSRRTATNEEVKAYLESKGFRSEPPYFYTNDDVWVSDFNGDNALIGEDGQVYLIDPVIDIDTHKTMKDLIGDSDRDGGIKFRDGDDGLGEAIAQMKEAASLANADNRQTKEDAMKAIGGNLSKLRQAMARQRGYDLSTVKSITDLVKRMLENGLLDDLGKAETKRILSAVNNVHGKQDTSKYVQKMLDMMVDNQLRNCSYRLGRLEKIRGSRVDARGIEVQGVLDADGVAVVQAFKQGKSLSVDELDKRILEAADRMGNDNEQISANATIEHTGLQLAKQYVEGITESKKAEAQYKSEVKKSEEEVLAGQMSKEAFKEFKDAVGETIRQLKVERVEAYNGLIDGVGGVLGESIERAKQWKEAEKERVNMIHHLANSDMQGRELKGHKPDTRVQRLANSWLARAVLAPMSTFDQMLKMFGGKNPNGEGYLQDYYMRHWIDSVDNEQLLKERYQKQMDDKAAEIFGKRRILHAVDKDYKFMDLYGYAQTQKSSTVKYYDGADMREYEIPQDGLLYLYAVEKMPMGRATNRRMGITEEVMERITEALNPKLKRFADWVQEEFLPSIGAEADKVYTRMFGTHMDDIENYFPFVRDRDALKRDVENGQGSTDNDRISVQTGAIKKRVASVAIWDLTGMSFLDVLAKHVGEMSHWMSFAELNRDIGTLLSYNRFKQQVMNMSSMYGAGKKLWKRFEQCAAIATDCYVPRQTEFDGLMIRASKGIAMGKISFRVFTALKQILSLPAFFGEVNVVDMAEALATGGIPALRWSWRNMPNFRKRILSRTTGDYRLRETEYDGKIMKASTYGMLPNIGVDAWTIAVGSHCVYKAQKRKYLRWGMAEDKAERRAVQDAEMCFNKSQQSSEGAYMAPIQRDNTYQVSTAMLYRNSSTSYTRETLNSARNLNRIASGEVSEDFVAKQILRAVHPEAEGEWTDAEWANARANAKREIHQAVVKNGVNLAIFGWILPWTWRIGGLGLLLLLSGDTEEKREQIKAATMQSVLGPMEGLTYGDVLEAGATNLVGLSDQAWEQLGRDNPAIGDIAQAVKYAGKDWMRTANEVLNILGGSLTGVNPQTFTDWAVAIMDYCGDDANTSRECAMLAARLLNCPQSQLDKVYFDELDATAREASMMTPAEIAQRYAEYKALRGAPLTGWMRSEAQQDSVEGRWRKRALTVAREKLDNRVATEKTKMLLGQYDSLNKRKNDIGKLRKGNAEEYRKELRRLYRDNDFRIYYRMQRYKRDIKEQTERYLRTQSTRERDSLVRSMMSTRDRMLQDVEALEDTPQ